jgi:hypothetical protein
MWLTRFCIQRPLIVAMFFIGLAIFGFVSYQKLGRNEQPNVNFPVVIVVASYPGASPTEMEKLIIKPIEDQLDGIEHLDQMTATAQEGSAVVVVQFQLDTDLNYAAIDVQHRVDTARTYMPTDLVPPDVEKNGADQSMLTYALSSQSMSGPALQDLVTDRIVPEIKSFDNVSGVDVYGEPGRSAISTTRSRRTIRTCRAAGSTRRRARRASRCTPTSSKPRISRRSRCRSIRRYKRAGRFKRPPPIARCCWVSSQRSTTATRNSVRSRTLTGHLRF